MLDLRFQTTSPQRSFDSPIPIKQRLRSHLLRARTLDSRNDPQRYRLAGPRRLRQSLKDNVSHPLPEHNLQAPIFKPLYAGQLSDPFKRRAWEILLENIESRA